MDTFTTTPLNVSERFGFWHDVVCSRFIPARSSNETVGDFHASLTTRVFGQIEISRQSATRHCWRREASHIRSDHRDEFLVNIPLNGSGWLEQSGKTIAHHAHAITLIDTSKPFLHSLDCEILLIKIPRRLLCSRFNQIDSMTALPIGRNMGLNSMLCEMVKGALMLELPPDMSTTAAARVANSILDLVSAIIDIEVEQQGQLSHRCAQQLERAQRYATSNLGDLSLSVEKMAKFGGISERTLNRLFASIGLTPMRWVWQQRLEASHEALADGTVSRVTDAAFQNGFSELSHFSRRFKAAYGYPPEELLRTRPHAR